MQMQVVSPDLERLVRDARRAGQRELIKDVSKGIRDELRPVVGEVRAKVRSQPSRTGRQRSRKAVQERPRGLRDAVARGVQMKVNLSGRQIGVRLRVDPRHFPDGQKDVPQLLEGTRPRWRSRNWGRDEWKTQPPHPYFFDTVRPHVPRVQAAVLREFGKLAREMAGGGR
jgi:hypothetical protein